MNFDIFVQCFLVAMLAAMAPGVLVLLITAASIYSEWLRARDKR